MLNNFKREMLIYARKVIISTITFLAHVNQKKERC